MTEKQENILFTALELFATQGYHAVSTSKIARQAGVSEALIFRHFENKEGLLQAIMDIVEQKTKAMFADIVMSTDPKEVIRKALELPFIIPEREYKIWRLAYALKWQINAYNAQKAEPLKLALSNAFGKLGYKNAAAEAELVLMFLDGAATAILLHKPANPKAILTALKTKYEV
ncbi:MAG TPA: helix-turn-helix domain-containing protein [Flavipsychrobacter sp.]